MPTRCVIGTRGSPLALAQTKQLRAQIAASAGVAEADIDDAFPLEIIKTSGDAIQDRRLIEAGGKGLFVKEIEEALLDGRIDLAVHSLKDMPGDLPDGLVLAAAPEREDPRDAFISNRHDSLDDLPEGARVGTASLRRQAQTLARRPDLEIVNLRGNVGTRVDKIAAGEAEATYLAVSGLKRLGRDDLAAKAIPPEVMLPAAAQGILGLETREDDADTRALLRGVNHRASEIAAIAERAFLKALDGSCRTPIAALALIEEGDLWLRAEALAPDGSRVWRREGRASLGDGAEDVARTIGHALGSEIGAEAGEAIRIPE